MNAEAHPATYAGLPPGPELSRRRQTARWMTRPVSFLKELEERWGSVFSIHLLNERPWVMVSDPELVKRVLTAPADVLHAGAAKRILEPVLGPSSLLLVDGDDHLRRRRLLLPPFHGSRVRRYEATMRSVAVAEIERWPVGVPGPAAPRMSAIALEVILRTVFGLAGRGRGAALREALSELVVCLSGSGHSALVALGESARLSEDRFAQLRARIARADELVMAEVARRRQGGGGRDDDVLSLLLAARYADGSPMSDRDLRDQLLTLVVAGHDTTAASLAWALERLVRHRAALERTASEAEGGGGPYTDAVVKETLRVRPVFMVVPRVARTPFALGDFLVPEGAAVTPCIPLVHRRPEVYPDPEEFRPERFLARSPGAYAWIPFGGGTRRCIGAGFSMLEMRAVLSTLLARARLQVESEEGERAVRRGLLVAPSRGGRVILERRGA